MYAALRRSKDRLEGLLLDIKCSVFGDLSVEVDATGVEAEGGELKDHAGALSDRGDRRAGRNIEEVTPSLFFLCVHEQRRLPAAAPFDAVLRLLGLGLKLF